MHVADLLDSGEESERLAAVRDTLLHLSPDQVAMLGLELPNIGASYQDALEFIERRVRRSMGFDTEMRAFGSSLGGIGPQ